MDQENKAKNKKEANVFDSIDGLKAVDPESLRDFEQAMRKKVVPEIVEAVQERRLLAAKSRRWQLKC
jgi:hypothetical protein